MFIIINICICIRCVGNIFRLDQQTLYYKQKHSKITHVLLISWWFIGLHNIHFIPFHSIPFRINIWQAFFAAVVVVVDNIYVSLCIRFLIIKKTSLLSVCVCVIVANAFY